jgi:hypothetical protein
MANVIKIKRSTVPGKVPLAGDLEVGELAVNTADGALYTKHSDNSVKQISANLATVTLDYAVNNGNTTARPITFSNTISSTSTTTGAIVITGGVGIGGNINVGGNIYVTGDILPSANNVSNIGSPTKRFNTLYVSANTIDIAGSQITTTEAGEIKFSSRTGDITFNAPVVGLLSNITVLGGATADKIQLGLDGTIYADGFYYAGNNQPVGTGAAVSTGSSNIINGNVTASGETVLVDSLTTEGNASVKWMLIATNPVAGHYKMSTVDSINDGANVYYNEYGVILSNSDEEVANFTSNIDNGNVRLWAINVGSGTQITFQRTSLGSSTVNGSASIETLSMNKGYAGSVGSTGYTGSRGEVGYTGSVTGFYGSAGGGAIGGNLYVPGTTTVSGNIIPAANVTYSLGSNDYRFKDLYLSGSTIYLGNTTFSSNSVLPFNLSIAPEVLTIQVDATEPGDDVRWFWTWETSTLPYARTQITNSPQISVPLYKQGTYTVNNFAANELHGNLTQVHKGYFKWIEGAGTQNLISWAVDQGNVNVSHPSINNGNVTSVQRYTVSVPSTITVPTLNTHTANYTVSFANIGSYTFSGDSEADNPTLGPLYRGGTYTFTLDSSLANHPFYLTTDNGTGFVTNSYVGEYTTGVTGTRANGQPGYTTLTFVVPNNAPSTLYYQCGVHSPMRGAIRIKDLAVDVNVNGNYVVYFQHTHEGHSTPIELRPIPSLVNQMCLVYDATVGQFVPQDMATYVENTPSFKNKIQEVAGTATLIAPDGIPVVPTVSIVEDASYLPFVGNKDGDISYAEDTKTLYVWDNNTWNNTKAEGGVGYTGSAGTAGAVGFTGSVGVGYTGSSGGSGLKQTRTMEYSGSLTTFNGTKRWWINQSFTISRILAFLSIAPTGTSVNLRVNKNGVSEQTISISANSSSAVASTNIVLVQGDYITVDITQIGSTVAGSDLALIFEYQ